MYVHGKWLLYTSEIRGPVCDLTITKSAKQINKKRWQIKGSCIHIQTRTHKNYANRFIFIPSIYAYTIIYVYFPYSVIICARNKILHLLLEMKFSISFFYSSFRLLLTFFFVWLIIIIISQTKCILHFTIEKVRAKAWERQRKRERESVCVFAKIWWIAVVCRSFLAIYVYATEWSKPVAMPTLHTNYLFIQSTLRKDNWKLKRTNFDSICSFLFFFLFCLLSGRSTSLNVI